MYPLKQAQITQLKVDKALIEVFGKYADFADIFFFKFTIELSKHIKINNDAIKLVDDWQSLYNFIYSLDLVELEI